MHVYIYVYNVTIIIIHSGKYSYFIREKHHLIGTKNGKITVMRRIAVRETCVSRHHGITITGSLEPLGPYTYIEVD